MGTALQPECLDLLHVLFLLFCSNHKTIRGNNEERSRGKGVEKEESTLGCVVDLTNEEKQMWKEPEVETTVERRRKEMLLPDLFISHLIQI